MGSRVLPYLRFKANRKFVPSSGQGLLHPNVYKFTLLSLALSLLISFVELHLPHAAAHWILMLELWMAISGFCFALHLLIHRVVGREGNVTGTLREGHIVSHSMVGREGSITGTLREGHIVSSCALHFTCISFLKKLIWEILALPLGKIIYLLSCLLKSVSLIPFLIENPTYLHLLESYWLVQLANCYSFKKCQVIFFLSVTVSLFYGFHNGPFTSQLTFSGAFLFPSAVQHHTSCSFPSYAQEIWQTVLL